MSSRPEPPPQSAGSPAGPVAVPLLFAGCVLGRATVSSGYETGPVHFFPVSSIVPREGLCAREAGGHPPHPRPRRAPVRCTSGTHTGHFSVLGALATCQP